MEKLPPLMQATIKGWKPDSPVDSLVFSPELKLLGRQPANDLIFSGLRLDVAYDQFLKNSLAGEEPGLGSQNETPDRIMIELVGRGKFKIDGKGPLTAKEARAEAVRLLAHGKKPILVLLKASPKAISDDEYNAFKESLHGDGGMLEGLDIKGLGEFRHP